MKSRINELKNNKKEYLKDVDKWIKGQYIFEKLAPFNFQTPYYRKIEINEENFSFKVLRKKDLLNNSFVCN